MKRGLYRFWCGPLLHYMKQFTHRIKAFFKALSAKTLHAVVVFVLLSAMVMPLLQTQKIEAAPLLPVPRVSFTFDDGLASTLLAAQTLEQYDYAGTAYITTDCVGVTSPTNNCIPDWPYSYLTWPQISQLQDQYGWEIGSHSVTHPHFPELTQAQARDEMVNSYNALKARGFEPTAFAYPYGEYSDISQVEASKVYSSIRRFQDDGSNVYPYDDNMLMIRAIQRNNGELNGTNQQIDDADFARVKGYIDEAVANNQWLVLVFHEITPNASTSWADYEYTPEGLGRIAQYIQTVNQTTPLPVVNMSDGLITSPANLMPNASFNQAIASSASTAVWWTDDAANIQTDTASNGSYPDPTSSVSIVAAPNSATANTHLFSPHIEVSAAETYIIKSFMHVQTITSGQIGYYIDEYDANGAWISGQDKASVASIKANDDLKVRALNFAYTPTSSDVASFRIEVVVQKGSGIRAYVDNFQVFTQSGVVPEPAVLGDLNGDDKVTGLDLSTLLANWSQDITAPSPTPLLGDLNNDGFVTGLDLSTLLGNWSQE